MSAHSASASDRTLRARTHELLDPGATEGWGLYVNWFIMGLIAANVTAVIAGTVDPVQARHGDDFRVFEVVSVAIFTVEYTARLWSNVEEMETEDPVAARLAIARRPMMVIDLLAIAPFYLALAGVGFDLRFLRALRLIRFLRLLKLVRYSQSMRAFAGAFRSKRDQLIVAMTANALLLVVASSLMYFAENDAQPEAFGSIPATMWWGIVTLTTVGYGDIAPITPLGRVLGGLVAVLGIGLFALPASILASGFIEESSYETTYCPDCGHEIDWAEDVGSERVTYEEGDWIRIDITRGSRLPDYGYHGEHGEIVACDFAEGTYRVRLSDGDEIEAEWDDLRAPYEPRAAGE